MKMKYEDINSIKDDVAEACYGVSSNDGELPPLELWLREQDRLQAHFEVENDGLINEETGDPLDLLIAREEAGEYDFTTRR